MTLRHLRCILAGHESARYAVRSRLSCVRLKRMWRKLDPFPIATSAIPPEIFPVALLKLLCQLVWLQPAGVLATVTNSKQRMSAATA
jgi:hypothetical protein